ncbi:MAG: hypothetical protein IRY97_10495, partial [Thermomicrobiaceae bacterium]|nr:hypothetical protein [Thermomicrobiaceae bacterium]
LTGVPLAPGHDREILYALSLPLGSTWLLALGGLIAAATGRTADLRALLSADWPDEPVTAAAEAAPPIDERSYARELREKRLARFWHASRAAAIERQRRERIAAVRAAMGEVLVRLDHLNHLLSVGEISMNRFTAVHAEWIAYLDALRTELIELESRRAAPSSVQRAPVPPTLVDLPPVRALTLAVVDRSGVPIATYGHFPLDETVVTGMLAAFESLSAEMFGSQVHKTQLAHGQVVHFARGRAVIAFALFEDEPAPVQVAQLRAFLDEFEQANAGVLGRLPIDPDHLTPIPVPFTFARRLEQAGAAAREAEPLLAGAPGIEPWAAAPTPDAGR